jgi:hypothetical protein
VLIRIFILLIIFSFVYGAEAQHEQIFQYIFPQPDSKYISTKTTLIFRVHKKWQKNLSSNLFDLHVRGEKSGKHSGETLIAKDQNTIIFKPFQQFLPKEMVSVELKTNFPLPGKKFHYHFTTSDKAPSVHSRKFAEQEKLDIQNRQPPLITNSDVTVLNGVAVPSDFPKIDVAIMQECAPGRLFLNNLDGIPYIMILENDGTPYFYRRMGGRSWDFKVQPTTGTLTRRVDEGLHCYVELDSTFKIIDTLRCSPNYHVEQHDIQLAANGNYLLFAWDEQIIDMSQLINGGDTSAIVKGNHIQELDRDGTVIFEWRSWDHYNILDAVHQNLKGTFIDYVHINALAIDYDNHILISSRNLSEVTKINRETGDIIWRLGGENNQFTFVNDPYGISYQHDIRPVPDKPNYYTLFDNGQYHSPQFSRAVEFYLDTLNMTATNVWEYRPSPDRYATVMGNVQRLPNGNTLINWAIRPLPKVTEVTAEKEVVYEMNFINPSLSYRSFRFEWEGKLEVPYLIGEAHSDKTVLIFNKFGDQDVKKYILYGGQSPQPITVIDTTENTWIELTDLINNQDYFFRVTALNEANEESDFSNEVSVFIKYTEQGENLILNGDYLNGNLFWELYGDQGTDVIGRVTEGQYQLRIQNGGSSIEDVQILQNNIALQTGERYLFEFDASADSMRTIEPAILGNRYPWYNYSEIGFTLLTESVQHFTYEFEMTHPSDFNAQIVFSCGNSKTDVFLDNISLKQLVSSIEHKEAKDYPENYHLFNNYPNPFNAETIIRYSIPKSSHVKIEVYNILGQKISQLIDLPHKPGIHQIKFNGQNIGSGIYFFYMGASSVYDHHTFRDVKKMILIR